MGYGIWTYSAAENATNTYTVGSGGLKVLSSTNVTINGTAPAADDIAHAGDEVIITAALGSLEFEY